MLFIKFILHIAKLVHLFPGCSTLRITPIVESKRDTSPKRNLVRPYPRLLRPTGLRFPFSSKEWHIFLFCGMRESTYNIPCPDWIGVWKSLPTWVSISFGIRQITSEGSSNLKMTQVWVWPC